MTQLCWTVSRPPAWTEAASHQHCLAPKNYTTTNHHLSGQKRLTSRNLSCSTFDWLFSFVCNHSVDSVGCMWRAVVHGLWMLYVVPQSTPYPVHFSSHVLLWGIRNVTRNLLSKIFGLNFAHAYCALPGGSIFSISSLDFTRWRIVWFYMYSGLREPWWWTTEMCACSKFKSHSAPMIFQTIDYTEVFRLVVHNVWIPFHACA